jgi:HEAT repeat protein
MTRRWGAAWVSLGLLCLTAAAPAAGEPPKHVRRWIGDLQKKKSAQDRASAARLLGRQKDPEAVAALAHALSDRDVEVRQAAASALWDTGKGAAAAEPALRQALNDPEPGVVARAAGALEVMGVDAGELIEVRRRALRGAHDGVTAFLLARGLVGFDPPAAVLPALIDYAARNARAMARPGSRGDYHENVESAEKALAKLAKTADRSAIPLLVAALGDTPEADPSLLRALGAYTPPPEGFAKLLAERMKDGFAGTRAAAAEQCRPLGEDADVAAWAPGATALLRDAEESVRMAALGALQTAGGRAAGAAPEIVRLLESDPSRMVRVRAAATLAELGDVSQAVSQQAKAQVAAGAKQALAAALNDPHENVAGAALSAYNVLFLPGAEAVETLTRLAESDAPTPLRRRALTFLRNRQGQAQPVLERIRALTRSPEVGSDAAVAVASIERGGPGSPDPLVTGSAGAAAPAEAPGPGTTGDAAAEQRGLAALRALQLPFDEQSFFLSLKDGQADAVRAFLDAGMSPSHVFSRVSGRSPLMMLFFFGGCTRGQPMPEPFRQIVQELLARGADVNQADETGNTALMFAASDCDRATIRLLLANGAKAEARDQRGFDALQRAIGSNDSAAEELIAAGARLDAETAGALLEAYQDDPATLAVVEKATPR